MTNFEHKDGYYSTLDYYGNVRYVKKSTGNKLRFLYKVQVEFTTVFNQNNPRYKEIDMEYISANENNETNNPLYEENRDFYKFIKNKILCDYGL